MSTLKLNPWDAGRTTIEIAELGRQITEGRSSLASQIDQKKAARALNGLEADKKKAETKLANLKKKGDTAIAAINSRPTVVEKIRLKIRETAAQQYGRGTTALQSQKSSMTRKKQYLGEIATTGALRSKGEKGKGVLWASPWSPGVNTAFIEGGASQGNVFKLKTPIPDHLAGFLMDGKITEFKAAVKDHTEREYYPFWNSLGPGRFTIYTDELAYLTSKGYRLHTFKRKNGQSQQLMVAGDKLSEVTAAYSGR